MATFSKCFWCFVLQGRRSDGSSVNRCQSKVVDFPRGTPLSSSDDAT